jgi:Cys-tRNA synthase (O-phospho-L-seryl-tRNA:Cys-tRNA synthase)
LKETFREGLKKKLKLAIVGMPRAMIVKVVNSTREIEKEMPITHRSR